jgi:hypothetical protein
MIVRIRFGRGPLVTRRSAKNGRAASLLASILSLVAISFAVLGFWRIGEDLGFAGDFAFPTGLLSHWQVWAAAACAAQYGAWRLTMYAKLARLEALELAEEETPVRKATARV